MEKKFAVLFDLDGVLIDSETIYTQIWNNIDRAYPTGVDDFARKIKGTTLEDILSTYFPKPEVRENVEKMLYDLESEIRYNMLPGASELLASLREAKIPVALVTSSNEIKMNHLFGQIPELRDAFDFIVTGDMVVKSKPDPEGYALAASKLGVPREQCVVVEDSLQGVKAGEALGGKVIGVSGTLPASTLAPHATIVVDTLEKVSPISISDLFN